MRGDVKGGQDSPPWRAIGSRRVAAQAPFRASASQALTEDGALPQGLAPATGPNFLRLEARGSQFRVLVNGSLVLEVQDSQIPGPGALGLSISTTNYPETVYFDNLEVSEP